MKQPIWRTVLAFLISVSVIIASHSLTITKGSAIPQPIDCQVFLTQSSDTVIRQFEQVEQQIEQQMDDQSKYQLFFTASEYAGCLGTYYQQQRDWENAELCSKIALSRAQAIQAWSLAYQWQWQLAKIYQAQDNQTTAESYYEASIQTIDTVRVTSNLRPDPERPLESFESIEAINLFFDQVDRIYRDYASFLLSSPSPDLKKIRQIVFASQTAELETFLQEPCISFNLTDIDAAIEAENSETAFIFPMVLDNRLELIVKLPNEPELKRYPSQEIDNFSLQNQIRNLKLNLEEAYTFISVKEKSRTLYDLLIRPIRKDLDEIHVTTLVFALDAPLRDIPMATLYDGGQYLIENFAIVLIPSLQLPNPQPLSQVKLNVLAAGTTEFKPTNSSWENIQTTNTSSEDIQLLSNLPNVALELQEIEKSHLPARTLINENSDPDKKFTVYNFNRVLNQDAYSIVHLATHGQFQNLSKDTYIVTEDERIGIQKFGELFGARGQLRSDAIELLILSACETAVGNNLAVLGIAGSAVRAGARSVIASLWSIGDKSGAVFTRELYKHLGEPGVSRAKALQMAQTYMLKQDPRYEHPRYWGAYVLVGNWL